jgi:indoleamine 2,3-dioxygenase
MRGHMPGKHREFLDEVAKLPSIRTFVDANPAHEELRRAFDDCLKELRLWRGKHIAVVSKYVIRPARLAAAKSEVVVEAEQVNEERSDGLGGMGTEGGDIQGTGGSALIPFLRQTRDETA